MTVEEILGDCMLRLRNHVGDDAPLVTITVSEPVYFKLAEELWSSCKFVSRCSFDQTNKLNLMGIDILRERQR